MQKKIQQDRDDFMSTVLTIVFLMFFISLFF